MALSTSSFLSTYREQLNEELLDIAGTTITLHSLNKGSVTQDTLYGEPVDNGSWDYTQYINVKCFIQRPSKSNDPREEGFVQVYDSEIRFSKKSLADNSIPEPKRGDVIESGFGYFDINRVENEAFTSDTAASYTVIFCELQRNTKFVPDNKVS